MCLPKTTQLVQGRMRLELRFACKVPLGILWVVFLTGRSLDHLPQSDLKRLLKCRVLDCTPDWLAQRSKLELLSKVPHTLAFAFLSSFMLAWPSPLLPLTLHRCTHCRYTQKYTAHLSMLGSYLGWRNSYLWNNSSTSSYLPNLVKFLFLFKTQLLWETFPCGLFHQLHAAASEVSLDPHS